MDDAPARRLVDAALALLGGGDVHEERELGVAVGVGDEVRPVGQVVPGGRIALDGEALQPGGLDHLVEKDLLRRARHGQRQRDDCEQRQLAHTYLRYSPPAAFAAVAVARSASGTVQNT